jgi:choline dehydrogenase
MTPQPPDATPVPPASAPVPSRPTAGMDTLEAAEAGVEELYRLTDDVGIPSLEELGFSVDEIPMLARMAFEDPQTHGNPREVDVAAYTEIYRNAFARGR